MTRDDEICLELGREVVRMIYDLRKRSHGERGYVRRTFTFPGGAAHLLMANSSEVADRLEEGAAHAFNIVEPPAEKTQ